MRALPDGGYVIAQDAGGVSSEAVHLCVTIVGSDEANIHATLTNLNLQLYSEPNENLFSESSNSMQSIV